jgi:hypothetical protein
MQAETELSALATTDLKGLRYSALLLLVATLGCSSGPQLCIRSPAGAWLPGIAFPVGTNVQFSAGRLDILAECDLPADFRVTWMSSAPDIAVIDSRGVMRGVAPGKAEIIARGRGDEQRFAVTVTPEVARIEITPGDTSIAVGDTVQFHAVAYGTDGKPMPEIVLEVRAGENPPRSPVGTPQGIDETYNVGPNGERTPTNTLWVHARHAGMSGHVTASVVGRADTVQIRSVPARR